MKSRAQCIVAMFAATSLAALAADTGSAGGGQPIDTMQPSLALTVLIVAEGYPAGPGTDVQSGGGIMTGEIKLFAGSVLPRGFLPADGSLKAASVYPDLFDVIGTTYGGSGLSTFRLPDLRGRAIVSDGQGPALTLRAIGAKFGSETVVQGLAQLPSHTHTVYGSPTGASGGDNPLSTIQPALAIHPVICPYGYYEELGDVRLFAGNYDPGTWMACQGQTLDRPTYNQLFTHLRTAFGGDGVTTFALPDLRGRVAIGAGGGSGLATHVVGESFGAEWIVPTESQLPAHTHTVTNGSTDPAGAGEGFENHQPTVTMRYIICTSEVYCTIPTPASFIYFRFMGEVRLWAGNDDDPVPPDYMAAEGQVLPIASHQGLYSVIGTTFGGDGVTTFALPDLRGRTPVGTGSAVGMTTRVRGESLGAEDTILSVVQMAPHTHVLDPSGSRHPGEPSSSLLIGKNAVDSTAIDLSWGTGCSTGATGYAVYQGTLGEFTSHTLLAGACDLSATSMTQVTPCSGDCYYLVSSIDDLVGEEGSLGRSSTGEIPRPVTTCAPSVDLATCQ